MKTVRLKDNIVVEVIPDYAFPVEKWYGIDFAAQCIESPDEVQQGWILDTQTMIFSSNNPNIESIKTSKLQELSQICNTTITTGCSITLADSTTGHITMSGEDQINLLSAMSAIKTGMTTYPYHLDGELCKTYSAADIEIMVTSATKHKIYHTTLYNHLKVWVNRCTAIGEVNEITYTSLLPDDLAQNMAEVLSNG